MSSRGTLTYLEMQGVGPARNMCWEPADRLSLITGDNGLGKSFLLECAWWALTGYWAGSQPYPQNNFHSDSPKIIFQISQDLELVNRDVSFDWQTQAWNRNVGYTYTKNSLVLYVRVDGSFAVWDQTKLYWLYSARVIVNERHDLYPFILTKDEVWNGKKEETGKTYINGLLQDWIQWQNKPEKYPFGTLTKVLERLSPPSESDLGVLKPGESVRLPFDTREIPALIHPYGTIPIVHASAGVQRIITIAYLIVWAWEEHKIQSELTHNKPLKNMVILIDELEAHLHPQWQRVILPAILDVREDLGSDLQVQIMVATHSPLVMASIEPRFNENTDKLFRLDLVNSDLYGKDVQINQLPFIRQGVVDSWLMSDVFQLGQARSLEAEKAIKVAKALQLEDHPKKEDVENVSRDLTRYLSENDGFWPRWLYFAEQHRPHP